MTLFRPWFGVRNEGRGLINSNQWKNWAIAPETAAGNFRHEIS